MESVGLLQFDSLGFHRTSTTNSDLPSADQSQHEEEQRGNNMTERVSILKNSSKSLDSLGCQRERITSFETLYIAERESRTERHDEYKEKASLLSGVDTANPERSHCKSNRFPFLIPVASSSYDDGDTDGGSSAIDLELFHILPLDDGTQSEFECQSYSSVSAIPQPSLNIPGVNEQKCSTQCEWTEEWSSACSHSAGSPLTCDPHDDNVATSTEFIQQNGSVELTKGQSKYRLLLTKSRIWMKRAKSQVPKLFALLKVVLRCKSDRNQVVESASEWEIATVVEHHPPDEEKGNKSSSTIPLPIEVTLVHSSRRLRWDDGFENGNVLPIDSTMENSPTRLAQLDSSVVRSRSPSPTVEKRMRVHNLATNSIPLEERRQLEESILRVLSQMKKSSFSRIEGNDDDNFEVTHTIGRHPTKNQTLYHDSKARTTMLGNDLNFSQADEFSLNRVKPPMPPATNYNLRDQSNNFTSFKRIVESKHDPVCKNEELLSEIKITGVVSHEDGQDSLLEGITEESEDDSDPTERKDPVVIKPEENKDEEDESVEAVMRGVRTVDSMSDLSEPPNIESLNSEDEEPRVPKSFSRTTPPPPVKDHQSGWRPTFDWVASDMFCTCDSEEPPTVSADIIAAALAAAAAARNQQEHQCTSFRGHSEMMRIIHTNRLCMDSCFDTCTSPDTSDDEDDASSGMVSASLDDDEKNIDDSERDSSVVVSDTGSSFISSSFVSSSVVS
jgi:hypothetical protein